mgnify:CR=1 FL=1
MPKKNDTLRFIQDLQPVNKVTIRNARVGPTIEDFAEAFTWKSIYSVTGRRLVLWVRLVPASRKK